MRHIELNEILRTKPNTQAANAWPTPEFISDELLLLNNLLIYKIIAMKDNDR